MDDRSHFEGTVVSTFSGGWLNVAATIVVCCLAACSKSTPESGVIRLVDIFPSAKLEGSPTSPHVPQRSEWLFEGLDESDWRAGAGVAALTIDGGRLVGRADTHVPILHVERENDGLDSSDILYEVVVQARVSAGSNLSLMFYDGKVLELDPIVERADRFSWPLITPLLAGEGLHTYTIKAASAAQTSFPASRTRHLLLRPTDAEGAEFEIESVRLVFRQEHLLRIPSEVSWQGLSEIYRETIVTRAPERINFEITLPSNPVFDLAVGTVEEGPLTFRVTATESATREEKVVLERTVTTPHSWQELTVDLGAISGQKTTLSLDLVGDDGRLGFWGAPAIRRRSAGSEYSPRGVVVILFDTLRRDHLAAYGYRRETAPTVSRLAREGSLFRDAIAQGAWTKVSVPSAFSSTYPTSNGIFELDHKLPASADTLAESFRAAGYATWAASGNHFSGRANNMHQGLEVLHERASLDIPAEHSRSKTARLLVDRLLPWLDSHRDIPFFVFLHANDPHNPYRPYSPYDTLWGGADAQAKHEELTSKVRPLVESRKRTGRLPYRVDLEEAGIDPHTFVQLELDWYDGSTRAADVEIRRVLEKLDELGLEQDTLIVFISDHGEEFLDHGGHFHEESVYGELINVPLVLRWPGVVPAGRIVEETVELVDVAPTILELAGLSVPERMQGESLVALLSPSGEELWTSRPAISEWKRRRDQRHKKTVDVFSIIADGYKLVHNVERPANHPEFELYNHREDPLDQNDVSDQHPDIVERLAKQLGEWHEKAVSQALPRDAAAVGGLEAEELARLRSLGYLQ